MATPIAHKGVVAGAKVQAMTMLDILLHPVTPYLTEYLYQEVFLAGAWKRPLLLQDLPKLSLPKSAKAESDVP